MFATPHFKQVLEGRQPLTREQARELMQHILAGALPDLQLAALLGALTARGETAAELAGFVDAMRAAATTIPLTDHERTQLVDTCGTGGDSSGTFNISTAAALVAAAVPTTADAPILVAKHGNRAVTSKCGSADVLEALGIPTTLSPQDAATALRRHRFAFLHAPALHPAMRAVLPVRRALAVRTVFNLLGPLTNPAGARAQVMGVYAAHLVPVVAQAMLLLDIRHAFVVHGEARSLPSGIVQGMDEFSISGPTQVAEVRGGAVHLTALYPPDLGVAPAPLDSLRGGDAAQNAAILRGIFAGEAGPRRDVVLLNAAAVLIAAGHVAPTFDLTQTLRNGIALAAHAVDSGAVAALVASLSTRQA